MSRHQDSTALPDSGRARGPKSDIWIALQEMVKQFDPNEFKTSCQQLAIDIAKQTLNQE